MGFDEKFIRTWEYYFDYCAAGFKSYTLGDYQVIAGLHLFLSFEYNIRINKNIYIWNLKMLYSHVNIRAYMIMQIVFSRPGNVGVLGNPYKGFPSAYRHVL